MLTLLYLVNELIFIFLLIFIPLLSQAAYMNDFEPYKRKSSNVSKEESLVNHIKLLKIKRKINSRKKKKLYKEVKYHFSILLKKFMKLFDDAEFLCELKINTILLLIFISENILNVVLKKYEISIFNDFFLLFLTTSFIIMYIFIFIKKLMDVDNKKLMIFNYGFRIVVSFVLSFLILIYFYNFEVNSLFD